jgi:hypothetical protein
MIERGGGDKGIAHLQPWLKVMASISSMARCVMASDTGSRVAARFASIFFTATSSALLRMPCSTSSQLMADKVSDPSSSSRRVACG